MYTFKTRTISAGYSCRKPLCTVVFWTILHFISKVRGFVNQYTLGKYSTLLSADNLFRWPSLPSICTNIYFLHQTGDNTCTSSRYYRTSMRYRACANISSYVSVSVAEIRTLIENVTFDFVALVQNSSRLGTHQKWIKLSGLFFPSARLRSCVFGVFTRIMYFRLQLTK